MDELVIITGNKLVFKNIIECLTHEEAPWCITSYAMNELVFSYNVEEMEKYFPSS